MTKMRNADVKVALIASGDVSMEEVIYTWLLCRYPSDSYRWRVAIFTSSSWSSRGGALRREGGAGH
jgi:hypothetical protein